MAMDLSAPRSRRALLAAALGGLAATAADALGRPRPAAATDGQPIIQGGNNVGSISTLVRSGTTTPLQGLFDGTTGGNYGVRGRSSSTAGVGVVGQVVATSGTNYGVRGYASAANGRGVRGDAPKYGVEGIATAQYGRGVSGESPFYGVYGVSTDDGYGVWGISQAADGGTDGAGVRGDGPVYGVYARSSGPVGGIALSGWALGGGPSIGAFGNSSSPTGKGVMGSAHEGPDARGVYGVSREGIGVHAEGIFASAVALKVTGKAVFSRSGKAIVPNGASSVTVSSIPLTAASLVQATIQGPGASGVYVRNVLVNPAASSFTITLSKSVAVNTAVAWFILN